MKSSCTESEPFPQCCSKPLPKATPMRVQSLCAVTGEQRSAL